MNDRFKGLIVISLILTLGILVFGCARNPRGTLGPSWDISLKAPAVRKDNALKDFVNTENYAGFGYNILDPAANQINLTLSGTQDQEIAKTVEVSPDSIQLSNLVDISETGVPVPPTGGDQVEVLNESLNFSKFKSLTIASGGLNVDLSNLTGQIDYLKIGLEDSQGNSLGYAEFSNVSGDPAPKTIDLAGDVLQDGINIVIAAEKSGTSEEYFDLAITSNPLQVTRIEDLDYDVSTTFSDSTTLDIADGTVKVGSEGADVKLNIDFPDESNLDFKLNSLTIGGNSCPDSDSDGYYEIPADTDLNGKLEFGGDLTNSGMVTYDTDNPMTLDAAIYGSAEISLPSDVKSALEATTDNYLVYKLEPSEFNISEEDLDRLDKNLLNGRLIIEGNNTLGGSESQEPIDLSLELYIGNSSTKTELYTEENLAAKLIEIEAGEYKHEFILDKEFRDKFRNKTYLGIKFKMGNGQSSVSFNPQQVLSLTSYAVLDTKVNAN